MSFSSDTKPPTANNATYTLSASYTTASNITNGTGTVVQYSGSVPVRWVPAFNVSSLMETMNEASMAVMSGDPAQAASGTRLFQAVCNTQFQVSATAYIGELRQLVSSACLLAHNSNITTLSSASVPRAEMGAGYREEVDEYLKLEALLEDKKMMIQNYIDYNQDVKTTDVNIFMEDTKDVISYYETEIKQDHATLAGYSQAITQVNLRIKAKYTDIGSAIKEGTEALEADIKSWKALIKKDLTLEEARQAAAMFFKVAQIVSAAGMASPEGAAGGESAGMTEGMSTKEIAEMKEWKEHYDQATELIKSTQVTPLLTPTPPHCNAHCDNAQPHRCAGARNHSQTPLYGG